MKPSKKRNRRKRKPSKKKTKVEDKCKANSDNRKWTTLRTLATYVGDEHPMVLYHLDTGKKMGQQIGFTCLYSDYVQVPKPKNEENYTLDELEQMYKKNKNILPKKFNKYKSQNYYKLQFNSELGGSFDVEFEEIDSIQDKKSQLAFETKELDSLSALCPKNLSTYFPEEKNQLNEINEERKKSFAYINSRYQLHFREFLTKDEKKIFPEDFREIKEEVFLGKKGLSSVKKRQQGSENMVKIAMSLKRCSKTKDRSITEDLTTSTRGRFLKTFLSFWSQAKDDRKSFSTKNSPQLKILQDALYEIGARARITEREAHATRIPTDLEMKKFLAQILRPGRTVGDLQLEVLYIFSTFFKLRTGNNLFTVLMNHVAFDAEQGLVTYRPWHTKTTIGRGYGRSQFRETMTRRSFPRQFAAIETYLIFRKRVNIDLFKLRNDDDDDEKKSNKKKIEKIENMFFLGINSQFYNYPLAEALLDEKKDIFFHKGDKTYKKFENDFLRNWLAPKLVLEAKITETRNGYFQNKSLRSHLAAIEKELNQNSWAIRGRDRTSQSMYQHEQKRLGRRLFSNYPAFNPISNDNKFFRPGQIVIQKSETDEKKGASLESLILTPHKKNNKFGYVLYDRIQCYFVEIKFLENNYELTEAGKELNQNLDFYLGSREQPPPCTDKKTCFNGRLSFGFDYKPFRQLFKKQRPLYRGNYKVTGNCRGTKVDNCKLPKCLWYKKGTNKNSYCHNREEGDEEQEKVISKMNEQEQKAKKTKPPNKKSKGKKIKQTRRSKRRRQQSKRRPSKRRPSKRRPSKRRPSKRRPRKRRPSKRRPSKRRPSKRRPSKRRPSKRQPSKRRPSKRRIR